MAKAPRIISRLVNQKDNDILDISVFVILTLLTAVLTLGYFYSTTIFNDDYSGLKLFGMIIGYQVDKAMNIGLFIPMFIIFIFLLGFFVFLRMQKTNIFISKTVMALMVFFVLARFITNVAFPYGEQTYVIFSSIRQASYSIPFAGFSASERIISFLLETLLIVFFGIAFTYIKTFSNKFNKVVNFFLYLLIAVAIVMNIFSYITESAKIVNNLQVIFTNSDKSFDHGIISFTSHRNVYGFFILMASLASMILSFKKKPNPLFLLLVVYFFITCFYLKSRTPFFLIFSTLMVMLVFNSVFFFKHYKIYSISSMVLFVFIVIFCLLIFCFAPNWEISIHFRRLFEIYNDSGTVLARLDLNTRALDMLSSSFYYVLFGYGKIPFINIYNTFGTMISQQTIWSSHNGFLDVLLSYGLVGLASQILCFGVLVYHAISLAFRKPLISFTYLFVILITIIYGFFEMRVPFGIDPSGLIFVFLLVYPIENEFSAENKKPKPLLA
ncbi:MAG: O-antigen ligase family protein [Bacilli bacterium]